MIDVESYTIENLVPDEDWEDMVRWEVNRHWLDWKSHDRKGYLAYEAGSPQCLALGHVGDPDDGFDRDEHPWGWDGDQLCIATRYDTACTTCERGADECEWQETNTRAFWKLFEGSTS